MTDQAVRKPTATTSRTPWSSLLATGLPPALEDLVRGRVSLVARVVLILTTAALVSSGVLLPLLLPSDVLATHPMITLRPYLGMGLLLSAVLFALARWPRLGPQALAWLVVGFEAAMGLVMGLGRHSVPATVVTYPHGVSVLCVLIILFPLIVPSTIRRALLAGLLAATMEALALVWWTSYEGRPWPPFSVSGTLLIPNFACAIIAVIPAYFVYHLGREVSRAEAWGSYQLVQKLGEGGMGEVWRAQHHTLARPAAIKLIRPDSMATDGRSEAALARFEREAQATARLRSPHAVELFDFGRTEGGTFFYVMELLEGFDLDTLVEKYGPLPAPRSAFLLWQVCDCLVDAHDAGLIHRDIKPANIYACRYGHRGDFVKVLDFGLVKLSQIEGSDVRLTTPGYLAGTPAFSAPEAAADPNGIDARSDLYSLGCVAYWLLTGRLLFDGSTPMKMLVDHLMTPPTVPSQHSELEIPAELDALVLDLLAKDPTQRPQTARAVMERLEQLPGWGTWDFGHARLWWDRHAPTMPGFSPVPRVGSQRAAVPESLQLAPTVPETPRVTKLE